MEKRCCIPLVWTKFCCEGIFRFRSMNPFKSFNLMLVSHGIRINIEIEGKKKKRQQHRRNSKPVKASKWNRDQKCFENFFITFNVHSVELRALHYAYRNQRSSEISCACFVLWIPENAKCRDWKWMEIHGSNWVPVLHGNQFCVVDWNKNTRYNYDNSNAMQCTFNGTTILWYTVHAI